MKIVADSAIPFLKGVLEPYAKVIYIPGNTIANSDIHDADALVVRTRTRCNEQLLAGSSVTQILTATIGFDHIDTPWCAAHGIEVSTAAGCNSRGVLQWISGVLAHLSRTQGWQPHQKTLGIVGVGHVGSLIREYAEAWGFRVLCCDPPRQQREGGNFLSLAEVAIHSDFITFHTPLDTTTNHMADAKLLSLMKPTAVVINSSRGPVVDGDALLTSGLSYILDVWEHEPHINLSLLSSATLATPHIAGYSLQGKANATSMSVHSLASRFNLPLTNWYPADITPSQPLPIRWDQMCSSITAHFDIEAQSKELKANPEAFESLRNNYTYRKEYF